MRNERGALAVFVRWPEPGRVLPQLVPRVGAEASAQVYESFIGDLIAGAAGAPFDAALYAADHADAFRERFPGVEVREQRGRGEGRRLRACFEELLATHRKAVIAGSSIPDLHPRMVRAAFEMLERRDVVIGPTERGGIYLLAMREPRDVFQGVRWDGGGVLASLLANFERAHLEYGFFPTRQKVETYGDLVALQRRLLRPMAPLTFSMLRMLGIAEEAPENSQVPTPNSQ